MSQVQTTTEKILFKTDSAGKIRRLRLYVEGADLCSDAGLLDGAKVTNKKTCKPKNVGRSNETTGEAQALSEMWSKVAEKKNEGYCDTVDEAKDSSLVLPMLASEFAKVTIDYQLPVFAQPKLDGMRCMVIKRDGLVILMSRGGKEITTLAHINKDFENPKIPDGIYDGEAYSLSLGNFQNQMKAIKKYRPGITEQVEYHLYDIVLDKPYSERYNMLKTILENL